MWKHGFLESRIENSFTIFIIYRLNRVQVFQYIPKSLTRFPVRGLTHRKRKTGENSFE
jgi:hypothetical protein